MLSVKRIVCVALIGSGLLIAGCPPAEQVGGDEPQPPSADDGSDGTDNTPPGGTPPVVVPPDDTPGDDDQPGTITDGVVANAGPDQAVESDSLVTLSGTGSTTAGVPLTFAWTQTAGTPVLLAGADSATATFVAPAASATLTFRLDVRTTTGAASDEISVVVQAPPILFVANRAGNSISRFRAGAELDGNVAPLATISGPATLLNDPSSIVFDRIGGILLTNGQGNRVSGFLNALTATGNIVPERFVGGAGTLLNTPEGAAYDSDNDLLFVANFDSFPGSVNVYTNVSAPTFNGDVAPARRIQSTWIQNARDVELSATGELYVLNAGGQDVSVFNNARTANGMLDASRLITSDEFTDKILVDMTFDSSGRMLVVDSSSQRVLVFANSATLSGDVTPDSIVTIPDAESLGGIVVDEAGRAYVSDNQRNAIYIYDDIAGAEGSVTPDRTIIGAESGLSGPGHMLLVAQ